MNIQKKMREEMKALETSLQLRRELIMTEVEFVDIKRTLNLTHYELHQLTKGKLCEEKMKEVWDYLSDVPEKVRKRNLTFKRFKLFLLDNGYDMKEAVEFVGVSERRLRAILTGERIGRQYDVERKIEEFCKQKLFL